MKKTLLIDTNNILNRSFYGIPPLTAADGRHTNAVYGMLGTLLPILEQGDFHFVAACFDLSAPTHRHRAYQDYKATRSKMPDELREQMPLAKEVLRAMGIAVVELEGYEADDIMGTLATRAASEGGHAFILSGDRDGLQLVSEGVSAMLISKGDTATMTPADVTAKYGVTPAQLLSVKALMGDASDNIPGVA
ncbi:MAG: hypothetical protein FWC10_11085, partial [Lentimicrobiaceae bacterium]|nr:hypothetical protein [Lentimicrobiaceae bacterium]